MKSLSFILFCSLVLASCQFSDDLVTPVESSKIAQRAHQQTRQFEATLSGALDPNSAPTVCSGDLQPLALFDYSISGNAKHFGNLNIGSTLHHDDCDLSFETALLTTNVSGQIVAANGDKIFYTGLDEVNVFNLLTQSGTTGEFSGSWTITGGTGRFDGASGSFTLSGLVDFTTFGFNVEAEGTITY